MTGLLCTVNTSTATAASYSVRISMVMFRLDARVSKGEGVMICTW